MQITRIEKAGRGRYRIWLNDEPAFCLRCGDLRELKLHEGDELDQGLADEICSEYVTKDAVRSAVRILASRDKTEYQLFSSLTRSGFPEEAAAAAVEEMKRHGYVDDRRYAIRFIEEKRGRDGDGKIRSSLKTRGIRSQVISEAFEACPEADQGELIRSLARRKGFDPLSSDAGAYEKAASSLLRRGFSYGQIKAALSGKNYE